MTHETPITVADIKPSRAWFEEDGHHLFPAFTAFEFFLKRHRDRLISESAYIPGRGSRPNMITHRMNTVIPEIWLEEAQAGKVA